MYYCFQAFISNILTCFSTFILLKLLFLLFIPFFFPFSLPPLSLFLSFSFFCISILYVCENIGNHVCVSLWRNQRWMPDAIHFFPVCSLTWNSVHIQYIHIMFFSSPNSFQILSYSFFRLYFLLSSSWWLFWVGWPVPEPHSAGITHHAYIYAFMQVLGFNCSPHPYATSVLAVNSSPSTLPSTWDVQI